MQIKNIKEVLINEKEIQSRIKELAKDISRDYEGKDLLLIGVLNGSVVFISDLIRRLTINFDMDFISVASYEGEKSTGKIDLLRGLRVDPKGRDILIVEDIVDSGLTLDHVKKVLFAAKPSSVRVCTLLDKSSARKIPVKIDYYGFRIPERFVVGYGLDHNGRHRGLPYLGIYKQ